MTIKINVESERKCFKMVKAVWKEAYEVLPPIREEMNGHGEDAEENKFLSWGSGEFGQHCHGVREDVDFNRALVGRFGGDQKPKFVACGASHTIVVNYRNEIFAWGNGNSGQLGTDSTATCREPQQIILYENQPQAGNPNVAGVACGGRHTVVWLANGNVFSFGNNFYAQLGYDFREKSYKENQGFHLPPITGALKGMNRSYNSDAPSTNYRKNLPKPHLLKSLVHCPVAQVSCGEKHSVFRFTGGAIACVGSNSSGQIGTGNRETAPVPKFLEMNQPIKYVSCGSNHSLAVSHEGEVYVWGFGKACGSKQGDYLFPKKLHFRQKNVMEVAGGSFHSMARTSSGSVYLWGSGSEGQLGFGTQVFFLSQPRRLNNANVRRSVVQISAGEAFSAAITENGDLFMWGKNSHIISPGKPSSQKFWSPVCVNRGGRPVKSVYCGSWHSVAISGEPVPLLHTDSDSEESDIEDSMVETKVKVNGISQNGGIDHGERSSELEEEVNDLPKIPLRKETTSYDREGTKISIAEFYGPEEDGQNDYKAPSPSYLMEEHVPPDRNITNPQDKPESAKSRIVVQVPALNFVDVATSPIPFSSSDSEEETPQDAMLLAEARKSAHSAKESAKETFAYEQQIENIAPSELPSDPDKQEEVEQMEEQTLDTVSSLHTKAPMSSSYERDKACVSTHSHPAPIRQFSRSTADNFTLPRESSVFTSRQIDFKEVEYARAISSTKAAPEKLFWMNKLNENRANESASVTRYVNDFSHNRVPTQDSHYNSRDSVISRGTFNSRYSELPMTRSGRHSETSVINLRGYDKNFDGTPTKWSRGLESSLADYGKTYATPQILEEARRAARLPPRTTPSRSIPKKSPDVNFAKPKSSAYITRRKLQIYKSDTVIAPLRNQAKIFNPKLNPMERYASVHNPVLSSTKNVDKKAKLGLHTPRKVSIPGGRAAAGQEEMDDLCVQGQTGMKNIVMYSSATSWRDKGDWARLKAVKYKSASPILVQPEGEVNNELKNVGKMPETNSDEAGKVLSDSIEDKTKQHDQKSMVVTDNENMLTDLSDQYTKDNPMIQIDNCEMGNGSIEQTHWSNKGFMAHRRKVQTTLTQTG